MGDADKYENQYGEFWRESTVNARLTRVVSDADDTLEQKARKATKPKTKQYCLVCGTEFVFRKRMTRNGLCRGHMFLNKFPKERFCTWCGKKFALNKTGTVYLCNSCKSKYDAGERRKY
ncbi:MAG: hypothetical protein P1P90_02400 [Patescibacteria group bacterium]|nr:hypothetical protein [Patescibacteria group bacterium]